MPHPVNLPSTLLCEDDSDRKTDSLGIPSSTILHACLNGSDLPSLNTGGSAWSCASLICHVWLTPERDLSLSEQLQRRSRLRGNRGEKEGVEGEEGEKAAVGI